MASGDTNPPEKASLQAILRGFERVIVVVLLVTMGAVIALATLDLVWLLVREVMTPPILLLEVAELLEIFGFVLLILIGLELLATIKAYLTENVVHVEIIIEVALIAIARKVIVLDAEKYPPMILLAIAALILALALAFYLERSGRFLGRRNGIVR
jgi:uncharacterized membrane protein (DUF373 family)